MRIAQGSQARRGLAGSASVSILGKETRRRNRRLGAVRVVVDQNTCFADEIGTEIRYDKIERVVGWRHFHASNLL